MAATWTIAELFVFEAGRSGENLVHSTLQTLAPASCDRSDAAAIHAERKRLDNQPPTLLF
jgi:hypothetical protein